MKNNFVSGALLVASAYVLATCCAPMALSQNSAFDREGISRVESINQKAIENAKQINNNVSNALRHLGDQMEADAYRRLWDEQKKMDEGLRRLRGNLEGAATNAASIAAVMK